MVINPEGAKIQMEGCITMGLGYALTEEVHFKGGRVLDTNYDTYEIPRFSWVPKIETVLIENNETAPQGGGEPAIILMGALIVVKDIDWMAGVGNAAAHNLPEYNDADVPQLYQRITAFLTRFSVV